MQYKIFWRTIVSISQTFREPGIIRDYSCMCEMSNSYCKLMRLIIWRFYCFTHTVLLTTKLNGVFPYGPNPTR